MISANSHRYEAWHPCKRRCEGIENFISANRFSSMKFVFSPEMLELAIQAALSTAPRLRKFHSEGVIASKKEDESPVTEADLDADRHIRSILSPSAIPIISEESTPPPLEEREKWTTYWIVDPLDGTKEFIAGRKEYTINIALIKNGIPILGVIAIPEHQLVYFGGTNQLPCKATEAQLKNASNYNEFVIRKSSKERPYTAVISRSHLHPKTKEYLQVLYKKHQDLDVIKAGSSLKFCRIVEGFANIYPRFTPCMTWDTAAGDALMRAIGKGVYQLENAQPLIYGHQTYYNPPFVAK